MIIKPMEDDYKYTLSIENGTDREFKHGLEALKLQVEAENCEDFDMEFNSIHMEYDGYLNIGPLKVGYNRHSFHQAISRIKPPDTRGVAGYLLACPPPLRADNFNFWREETLNGKDEHPNNLINLRLKTTTQNVVMMRAMVSRSYVPVDDVSILNILNDRCESGALINLCRGDIISRYNIFWPSKTRILKSGDMISVGIKIVNSEVLASSVKILPVVHFIGGHSHIQFESKSRAYTVRHVGEAKRKLSNVHKNTMDTIDPLIECLNEAYDDSVLSRFESYAELADCVQRYYLLSEDTKVRLVKELENRSNVSRYDLSKVLASIGYGKPLDEADTIQSAAGNIIWSGWRHLERMIEDKNDEQQ